MKNTIILSVAMAMLIGLAMLPVRRLVGQEPPASQNHIPRWDGLNFWYPGEAKCRDQKGARPSERNQRSWPKCDLMVPRRNADG